MDNMKLEDSGSSNTTTVGDTLDNQDPPTKDSTEMETITDDVKEETNDATTSTPAAATVEMKEVEEPTDDAKEEIHVEDIHEPKKDDDEEEKTEDKKKDVPSKSTESGKKKRKKSLKGETTTTVDDAATATKRSSRDRKSVEVYDPKIYDKTDKSIQVIEGRGTALKNISKCRDAIESAASSSSSMDELQTAYKFVFGSKYKTPPKKDMVQHLLDFNGYLPKKDSSLGKEAQEKADEDFEAKMGARAYKMTIQGLKRLCDFFAVDRTLTTTKDALVDKLLDFLGAPQKNKVKDSSATAETKTSKNKGKSKPTKRAKTEKKGKEEENDEDEEEEEEDNNDDAEDDDDGYDDVDDDKLQNGDTEGELPSKETLRKWVRAYVRCFHQTKLTVNHALEVGTEKFGVDLLPMKADLKKLLIEEL